jgi:hypothetical protein
LESNLDSPASKNKRLKERTLAGFVHERIYLNFRSPTHMFWFHLLRKLLQEV